VRSYASLPTPPASLISSSLNTQLNQQALREFSASQEYLSAAQWFEAHDFNGIAAFLQKESDDERKHAIGILEYIQKRNGETIVPALPSPSVWGAEATAQSIFDTLYALEVQNGRDLDALYISAGAEGDPATQVFIADYIKEQTDATAAMATLNTKVQTYSAFPGLLDHLDKMIG
jgi:ferritin